MHEKLADVIDLVEWRKSRPAAGHRNDRAAGVSKRKADRPIKCSRCRRWMSFEPPSPRSRSKRERVPRRRAPHAGTCMECSVKPCAARCVQCLEYVKEQDSATYHTPACRALILYTAAKSLDPVGTSFTSPEHANLYHSGPCTPWFP